MATNVDQRVRLMIGDLIVQIHAAEARAEALADRVVELEKAAEGAVKDELKKQEEKPADGSPQA